MKKLRNFVAKAAQVIVACLSLSLSLSALAATTTQIANIESASTDGTVSSSLFELSVTSGQMANALTTVSDIELSVSVSPQQSHVGLSANVYSVIVANGAFYKLTQSGAYSPWDGSIEDLTPFAINQTLSTNNRFTLLDGKMADEGDYLYFVAYDVEGESRLLFTPDPAQISVAAADVLPDDSTSSAAEKFTAEIETAVVQAKCILCHVEGGLARNSSLQFQRTNTASALNNFSALSAYIDEKGAELLLAKVTGKQAHAGGTQLEQGSSDYAALQAVLDEIIALDNQTLYAFSASDAEPTARQASFLTEVTLEPREATLRRATLLMQGRLPTDAERRAVVSDAALRKALRELMQGEAFREFVVASVNDRLLTEGSDSALNTAYQFFLKLHNLKAEVSLNDTDWNIEREIQDNLRRTSGELVAHVIENELPYSEILTADYMMMNRTMNTWLEGTATFTSDDSDDVFKPSVVRGYYYRDALEEVEFHENSNSIYRAIGEPVKDFPHAGLLTDFGFLSRYPTTATNRNRARARWTFYHFLGIDIEKSSQRPTDEASLSDRNNPTMNNANCTVCHALLDPVAGAFQNWDEDNFYRGSGNGQDALDGFYKYPRDGSQSPYRRGDLWYRDMRDPGLFDVKITERDTTLRELGRLIAEEPLFLTASAAFWWSPVFGKPLLDKPAVESDNGYAAKLAAYRAQQDAISSFGQTISVNMNAKDMLVDMFMSPWFSGDTISSYTFDTAHFESKFGSDQLLTPEQMAKKTRAITGVAWRTSPTPDGQVFSDYQQLAVLLGGIDSEAVTSRAIELTPTMAAILMTHATETACVAVARQFAKPIEERSLFTFVEQSTQPQIDVSTQAVLPSESESDWKTLSFDAELTTGSREISLSFVNPECDWDGSRCVEQRILYISSVSITSPSGKIEKYRGNDPRLYPPNSWMTGGGQNCHTQNDGVSHCYGGKISIDFNIIENGKHRIEAVLASRLMPSKPAPLEILLSVKTNTDILKSDTKNSRLIRQQIVHLFDKLHGTKRALDSDEVQTAFEIYAAALVTEQEADGSDWEFENCAVWRDGYFFEDLLTPEQLAAARTINPIHKNWYDWDWKITGPIQRELLSDPLSTKYAWTAVMMYMLSHYDYLHE